MKKIIWAVDAFQEKNKAQDNCIATLKSLATSTGAEIEPVYMLSDGMLGLSVPAHSIDKNFKPSAQKALQVTMKKTGIPNLLPAHIITRSLSSVSDAAKHLDTYAKSRDADLIVVASHARKGLSRFLLGSFSETLLTQAKTPVLVVGPKATQSTIKHIIFPTDFSKGYEKVFAKVVRLAKDLRANIVVMSAIPFPVDPVMQSGFFLLGGGWLPVDKHIEDLSAENRKKSLVLVALAKKAGVSAKSVIEPWSSSATDAVLKQVKKQKSDLIAMAAQSTAVSAALLGSVTRQVIRSTNVPVWVLRNR